MTKTFAIKKPITILADQKILEQLPQSVTSKLGAIQETGFALSPGRRDLFCEGGVVQYILGSDTASVELD